MANVQQAIALYVEWVNDCDESGDLIDVKDLDITCQVVSDNVILFGYYDDERNSWVHVVSNFDGNEQITFMAQFVDGTTQIIIQY